MQLGLLVTAKCNASCSHCATSCGPEKSTALSGATLSRLMDEAAMLTPPDERLIYSISGGEPFLDFPKLLEMVRHGAVHGAEVTCVSNGYWAHNDEKARGLLEPLKAAGLTALGISTSSFHQRYVKLARVQRALRVARDVGIDTVLKYATTRATEAEADALTAWAQTAGVGRVERFPVLPYLRDGAELPQDEYQFEEGLPTGRCPIPSLTVREDGQAYSCCAPSGFVPFLSVGNVIDEGLSGPYHRFLLRGKQRLLRTEGPIRFARAIQERGLGDRLRRSYVGVCDLCAHIATDPQLAAVANEVSVLHECELLEAVQRSHPPEEEVTCR